MFDRVFDRTDGLCRSVPLASLLLSPTDRECIHSNTRWFNPQQSLCEEVASSAVAM